jgi:predicted permease
MRLVQLVLVESAWLAFFAAALGALFAWWSAPFVAARINPPDNPARLFLPADWRVFAFGVALTFGVTLLFGLTPALRASAVKPAAALKGGDGPPSRGRWMRGLIAIQAAFCFLVLFTAGLFVATLNRLSHQALGFSAERLLIINTVTNKQQPTGFFDQLAANLRKVPGVEKAAYADWPLLDGYSFKSNVISIDGAAPLEDGAWFMNISPGWMDAMKIPFLDGRDFRPSDTSPGAAIVNEAFAKRYFNGANPVGKWFAGTSSWMRGQRFQIVGLVADARYRYLRESVLPVAYTPFNRLDDNGKILGGTFIVRTSSSNPLALASLLRREIARIRPEFRVNTIGTQGELDALQTIRERLLARLALFFSGFALLLAAVGLYGVLHYSVQQRQREIGIRLAIGAQAAVIARLVTMDIFCMVCAGAAAGLAASLASARYIESLLYQVKPVELDVLATPWLMIVTVALLAALPVVLHAVHIDPVRALRSE